MQSPFINNLSLLLWRNYQQLELNRKKVIIFQLEQNSLKNILCF